jgi:hypothetical protein
MLLCSSLQRAQRSKTWRFELVDPTFLDVMERDGIQVVQLLPTPTGCADQIGGLENGEVLGRRLTGHVEVLAELAQRLPVALVETVEQVPSGSIGERLEQVVKVVRHDSIMQVFTCIKQPCCSRFLCRPDDGSWRGMITAPPLLGDRDDRRWTAMFDWRVVCQPDR